MPNSLTLKLYNLITLVIRIFLLMGWNGSGLNHMRKGFSMAPIPHSAACLIESIALFWRSTWNCNSSGQRAASPKDTKNYNRKMRCLTLIKSKFTFFQWCDNPIEHITSYWESRISSNTMSLEGDGGIQKLFPEISWHFSIIPRSWTVVPPPNHSSIHAKA